VRTSHGLLLFACLAVAAGGCAGLPSKEEPEVRALRQQAANVLDTFAAALRHDTPELVDPLLAPALSGGRSRELKKRAENVVWLQRYEGYTLDSEAALADVSRKELQRGAFRVEVPASNQRGERLEHEFELVLIDGHWRIRDFQITDPAPGDALDLPAAVKDEIMPQLVFVLENMKLGRTADVFYELPDINVCRHRPIRLSWWQNLFSGKSGGWLSLYEDLERTKQFHFPDWPEPDEVYGWAYVPPGGVMAVYEVPYIWREGGINEPDVLRIHVIFMKMEGQWRFYTLRLSGEGIPYT